MGRTKRKWSIQQRERKRMWWQPQFSFVFYQVYYSVFLHINIQTHKRTHTHMWIHLLGNTSAGRLLLLAGKYLIVIMRPKNSTKFSNPGFLYCCSSCCCCRCHCRLRFHVWHNHFNRIVTLLRPEWIRKIYLVLVKVCVRACVCLFV